MEKKYTFPEENPEKDMVNEPAIRYERQPVTELKGSPPLTEEELKNALTGEEFLEGVLAHIDKLFDKNPEKNRVNESAIEYSVQQEQADIFYDIPEEYLLMRLKQAEKGIREGKGIPHEEVVKRFLG